MTPALANHLLQSTIFAAAAAVLTLFLRNNHARTRYWIWLTASMKFLIPFSIFVELGHRLTWQSAPVVTQPQVAFVLNQISQPFATPDLAQAAPVIVATAPLIMPVLLLAIWICGFAAVLIFWFARWRRISAMLRAGVPVTEGRELNALRRLDTSVPLIASPTQIEPGVFGILHPALSLPAGIAEHLDDAQLDAIFAHELCHIRRRDNLTAALHMLVEAIFWFHPLVWWIGARLVEERERACDEEVVRLGSDPELYAEAILRICKIYLASPLTCAAGISGADLRKRVESIMADPFLKRLSFGKKVLLGAMGVLALLTPIAIGILSAPAGHAQSKTAAAPSSPTELLAQAAAPPPGNPPAVISAPSATAATTFEDADVHATGGVQNGRSGFYAGGRYELRNATMLDLITNAYGVEGIRVVGGPGWMEADRFDVIAKAPPASTPETLRMMLRSLLAARFGLVAHNDTKSLQAYVLTVGKRPLMKSSDGSGTGGCEMQPLESTTMNAFLVCHNMTMAAFADTLRADPHPQVRSYVGSNLVADLTGLKGSWDFSIKWSGRGMLASVGSEGVPLFEAIDKQLGLKLELQKASFPVVVVDTVNQKPTGNPAGVTRTLPPPPLPAEFEVADIKLSTQDKPTAPQFSPGGRMDVRGITLMALIQHAWSLDNLEGMIVGGPKFLDSERFDIVAKATLPGGPAAVLSDDDTLRLMLRALLIDRFKLATHTEEQPTSVYALVAANPKLKKADPSSRSGCRNAGAASVSVMVRTFICDNMTMPQFAARLGRGLAATYTNHPIVDATGIDGAWDFTFSFSLATQLQATRGGGAERSPTGGVPVPVASDPNGAISLFDALENQLGLKLVQQKHPMPVLVIDHVEQKPIDN